jgi:hypothetical protein
MPDDREHADDRPPVWLGVIILGLITSIGFVFIAGAAWLI